MIPLADIPVIHPDIDKRLPMNTLLNHVASLFGRQPPIHQPISEPSTPALRYHLASEVKFDFAKARNDKDWAYFYDTDDGFHYAIGQHGWMPILLAGFIIGGSSRDGVQLISTAIAERLWLPEGELSHASWLEANQEAIKKLAALDCRSDTDHDAATEFAPAMFTSLPARVVSSELRTMWRRAHPYRPETFLFTTHAHGLMCYLPWMQEAYTAPQTALAQLLDWTANWFMARGMSVNPAEMLVAVPEYQPLFHVDNDPGAF